MLEHITPVVLTYNEEENVGRTLRRLSWASDIVVLDSFSSDNTVAIARNCPQVRVFQRTFDTVMPNNGTLRSDTVALKRSGSWLSTPITSYPMNSSMNWHSYSRNRISMASRLPFGTASGVSRSEARFIHP